MGGRPPVARSGARRSPPLRAARHAGRAPDRRASPSRRRHVLARRARRRLPRRGHVGAPGSRRPRPEPGLAPRPLPRPRRGLPRLPARRDRLRLVTGWTRWLLVFFAAAVVFAVGIALGEAIHDNPKPRITFTTEITVHP